MLKYITNKNIQDGCGRIGVWLHLRGPHNFISFRARNGHNPSLLTCLATMMPLLFVVHTYIMIYIYNILSCWVTDDFPIVFFKKKGNIPTTIRLNLISDRIIIIIYLITDREFMHFDWLDCVEELGCMKCAMNMTGNILSKTLFSVIVRQKAMT